jgi:hypothetical protein
MDRRVIASGLPIRQSLPSLLPVPPPSEGVAGGTLRRMTKRFVSTLRFVNEELAEQPTEQRAAGLRADWLEMLAEDRLEMKLAYLEFMRISRAALLPG